MYLSIVLLPLVGSMLGGLCGHWLGHKGSAYITSFCVGLALFFSSIVFYEVILCHSTCSFKLFYWINSGSLVVSWGFLFDSVTSVMLIVVLSISFLVHLYSIDYMSEDPHFSRFMAYLSLFTFFMLMLITGDNFLQLFLGWEGVGLCSYLLINFWYTRYQANKSAIKAIIVNRVGDFGLGLGLVCIFYVFNSLDYGVVFSLAPFLVEKKIYFLNFEVSAITVIVLLLFIGAVGKSAQLGLHTWLPDAMEGPTPVSALIHAATMVTAGVFLLIRCSPILEYSPTGLFVITIVGALTAFFAATTGMLQNDLKRVIAYSTCSQLGYMVFSCGLSNYSLALFHLANHAFFKALLFLSAGGVIHSFMDEQDMRKMGGLLRLMPFTYMMIVAGSLSLMGFPFLTGFYSKDAILEIAGSVYSISGLFSFWLGVLAAFFTAFYSFRLLYLTFISVPQGSQKVYEKVHDVTGYMFFSMFVLFFCTVFIGFLGRDLFIGLGTDVWGLSVHNVLNRPSFLESEFLSASSKLIPFWFSMLGALIAYIGYSIYSSFFINYKFDYNLGRKYYYFLNNKWYFDNIYNFFIAKPVLVWGYVVGFKFLDRGLLEHVGPTGIVRGVQVLSARIRGLQTGYIYHYIFIMVVGVVLITLLMLYGSAINFIFDSRLLLIYIFLILGYFKNI